VVSYKVEREKNGKVKVNTERISEKLVNRVSKENHKNTEVKRKAQEFGG